MSTKKLFSRFHEALYLVPDLVPNPWYQIWYQIGYQMQGHVKTAIKYGI